MTTPPLRAISLFSGAGGLDLGFLNEGFSIVYAVDNDKDSCRTYEQNIGSHVQCLDVRAVSAKALPPADVVIGGPPCQGFSVAGHMDPNDPRSGLVWEFFRVVREARPKAFVMENVKALAALSRWQAVRDDLQKAFEDLQYQVDMVVLNASHHGVPQARERVFFFGTAREYEAISVPAKTSEAPTVRQVLEPLPKPGTPPNLGVCRAKITPAKTPIMRRSPYAGMMFNGQGRPIRLDATVNTLPASMGGNRTPIVDEQELRSGSKPWVCWYHSHLANGGPPVDHVPPFLRRLTVTEAALLQTFPLEFSFQGSQSSQYRQIGNAVPPLLASAVAKSVHNSLRKASGDCGVGGHLREETTGATRFQPAL